MNFFICLQYLSIALSYLFIHFPLINKQRPAPDNDNEHPTGKQLMYCGSHFLLVGAWGVCVCILGQTRGNLEDQGN